MNPFRSTLFLLPLLATMSSGEKLPFVGYSAKDGLGSGSIRHISQDEQGFLWLSTQDGIGQFDGYGFTTFGTEHGLPEVAVASIQHIGPNDYWILTGRGALYRFKPDSALATHKVNAPDSVRHTFFTHYPLSSGPGPLWLHRLYKDHRGTIWFANDKTVLQYDSTRRDFLPAPVSLPRDQLIGGFAFTDDHEGSVWIATQTGIVRLLSDGRALHYPVSQHENRGQVKSLTVDDQLRVWVGLAGAGILVFRVEPGGKAQSTHHLPELLPMARRQTMVDGAELPQLNRIHEPHLLVFPKGKGENFVTSSLRTSNRHIWHGTRDGLLQFDGTTFRMYTTRNGMINNSVRTLLEDRDGNLWVGTNGGLMKLPLTGFVTYTTADGLGSDQIEYITSDSRGNLYVVGEYWAVSQRKGAGFSSLQPGAISGLKHRSMSQYAYLDRSDRWWFLTTSDVLVYPPPSHSPLTGRSRPYVSLPPGPPLPAAVDLFLLYEDRSGNLWLGSRGENAPHLHRIRKASGIVDVFTTDDDLPVLATPTVFREDRFGQLWIGFRWGGIARFADNKFAYFPESPDGIPSETVTDLYVDDKDRLWISTNIQGVARIDDLRAKSPGFTRYSTRDGLSSNNIRTITGDEWGHIYFGTVRGVDRLNPATGTVRQFTTADGLAADFVTSSYRDRNGVLWYGTFQGLSRFVPQPPGDEMIPAVHFTDIAINNEMLFTSSLGLTGVPKLSLAHSENNLRIGFRAVSFAVGDPPKYQYRLDGDDKGWSRPGSNREVDLAGLDAGTYRFLVRAAGRDGKRFAEPASFAFTISPPFWKTWWFLSLMVLAGCSAAYWFHRYRLQNAIELERMRSRIATDLHDDVGATLTRIAIHSELIQHNATPDRITTSSQEIAAMSRDVIRTFGDIVWSIDIRHDTLGDLLRRMKSFGLDLLSGRDITLRFNVVGADESRLLPGGARQDIYLIFKEAINNVARHSGATEVLVGVQQTDRTLNFSIEDNGKGLPEQVRKDGHGLRNMKMRAERIGATLVMESNNGLRMTLTWKMK